MSGVLNMIEAGAVWIALRMSRMQTVCRDFQIKHTAFRLIQPYGGLLVLCMCHARRGSLIKTERAYHKGTITTYA